VKIRLTSRIRSPLIAASFDLTMLMHHCGLERSVQMWKDLIGKVEDLEIVRIEPPPGGQGEGIVEIERV
jgi:hypothetical protein